MNKDELDQASDFYPTPTNQGSLISIRLPEPVVNKTVSVFFGCILTEVIKELKFPRGKIYNSSFLKSYAKSSLLKKSQNK